jgi:hypothetical protein
VSTFAAARTIADAIGTTVYYLQGNTDLTLAATHVDWEFIGIGSVADNIINLGSQDVSRSLFYNLTIEGTQGGAGRITARDCALQDPGAGATTLHIYAERCGFVDDIEVDTSNDNVFDSCYSLVAGTAAPSITATGAAGTISVRHYSGGLEFKALSASHNVTWEGIGQVIFNANCNVNANVSVRGVLSLTDNTAGMSSLTRTADAIYQIGLTPGNTWDEVLTGATHNIADSAGRRIRNLQEFGTYVNDSVWIDTIAGAAGTTDYESGTILNKVDSIADANTIAASLGLNGRSIMPGSSITLAAAQENQNLWGNNWTLALGGQSVSNTHISGAEVTGICTGASKPEFHECNVGSVTVPACRFVECDIDGTVTLPVGIVEFHHSQGEASGVLDYGALVANTTVNWTDFSGELVIDNLGATGTDVLNIRGQGKITLNASCTGGTINWDGHFSITNNGTTSAINGDDISSNVDTIIAEHTAGNLGANVQKVNDVDIVGDGSATPFNVV